MKKIQKKINKMENTKFYVNLHRQCMATGKTCADNSASPKRRTESLLKLSEILLCDLGTLSPEEATKIYQEYKITENIYRYTLEKSFARDENGKTEWEEK